MNIVLSESQNKNIHRKMDVFGSPMGIRTANRLEADMGLVERQNLKKRLRQDKIRFHVSRHKLTTASTIRHFLGNRRSTLFDPTGGGDGWGGYSKGHPRGWLLPFGQSAIKNRHHWMRRPPALVVAGCLLMFMDGS